MKKASNHSAGPEDEHPPALPVHIDGDATTGEFIRGLIDSSVIVKITFDISKLTGLVRSLRRVTNADE